MQQVKTQLRGTNFYPPLKALWVQRQQASRGWRRAVGYRRMRRFYAQFIKPGDLAFDVGANVGSRTRVFLQLGARVVAVEPRKECARALFVSFYNHRNFHLVNKALGTADGTAEMAIGQNCRVSTLSKQWMQVADQSQHLPGGFDWEETRWATVTTLDALIATYGLPSFIKIDAEGFEYEIVRGLSRPPVALSFEFLSAYMEPALQSIDYLRRFGPMRLNYAIEERFKWMLDEWVTPDEMMSLLEKYRNNTEFLYGDVYVRFTDSPPPATNRGCKS